jgi:hypothetical protein
MSTATTTEAELRSGELQAHRDARARHEGKAR